MFSPMIEAMLELFQTWFHKLTQHVDAKFDNLEKLIVKNFQDLTNDVAALTGKVTDLTTAAGNASAAVAAEIARVEQIIADLRANAGSAPTPEQIDALATTLESATANLTTVQEGLDAATTAANAVEPPVTPAP